MRRQTAPTGPPPRLSPEAEAEIARLDRVAHLLDAQFRIPVIGYRFGYDALLGLVPVFGDALAAAPAAWMIHRAHRLGMPTPKLARMAANLGVDFVFGSVPVLGSVFDVVFKANLRNMALLRDHIRSGAADARLAPGAARPAEAPRD